MRIIKQENFINNSGFFFEDLIEKLLYEEYGAVFTHTKYTNDGGKDFEGFTNVLRNQKTWVECKKYTNLLSYNDVSNTLLMAYVKEINKVLIFSVSAVNTRFYKKIAEYKDKTKIEVEIYDDENLESLLLKYKNKEWFSDYIHLENAPFHTEETKDIKDISYSYSVSSEYKKNIVNNRLKININETLILQLLIVNKSSKRQFVNINLEDYSNHPELEILDIDLCDKNDITIEVPKCTAQLIKIPIKFLSFQEIYKLPFIVVSGKKLWVKERLYTSWLAETTLTGQEYKKVFNNIVSHIHAPTQLNFVVIKGRSGTGKSIIMKELSQNAIRFHNSYFYCDIDKKVISLRFLCQELFSFFTKLPLLDNRKKRDIRILSTNANSINMKIALEVLYNQHYDVSEHLEEISKCIFSILQNNKYVIMLDNLQKYDSETIHLIENIISLSSNYKCNSVIILAYNTTVIPATNKSLDLLFHFENLALHKPERYYIVELEGFNEKSAKEYIASCLKLEELDIYRYEKLFQNIIKKFGTNALVLQSLLIYLHRQNYISIENNKLYIKDIDVFYSKINDKFNSFDSVLNSLEDVLLTELNDNQLIKYYDIIGTLNIVKSLPQSVFWQILMDRKLEEKLIQFGIILFDKESNTYSYKHTEIRNYYINKYWINYVDYKSVINYMSSSNYKHIFTSCIFLFQMQLDYKDEKIINDIKRCILNDEIDCENIDVIYQNILTILQLGYIKCTKTDIYLFEKMCSNATHFMGIRKSLEIYEKIVHYICNHIMVFQCTIYSTTGIFKEYLRHLMNESLLKEALHEINFIYKAISRIFGTKEYSYIEIELKKINVLVAYKLGQIETALTIGKELETATKDNNLSYCEVKLFLGATLSRSDNKLQYKSLILNYWETAYNLLEIKLEDYNSLNWNEKAILLNIHIKKNITQLVNDTNFDRELFFKVFSVKNRTGMPYFEVKLRHLLILTYLIRGEDIVSHTQALSYVEECLDILCTEYGNKKMYATSFFLLAKIYITLNQYDDMYNAYMSAYGIFIQLYSKEEEFFLIELIRDLRRYRGEYKYTFNNNFLNLIQNYQLKLELFNLLQMSDDYFYKYLKDESELSLIFDKNSISNLPII